MAETDKIQIPTYEQIAVMLTKLATNYSNLAILFYDIFYNTTPMDVTFQMYNEAGVLETFTIPNRAKDMANIMQGNGTPQGSIEAVKGVIYQDLGNGDLYIKLTSTGSNGWTKFVTEAILQDLVVEGIGTPEEIVIANKGTLYIDRENAELYMKATDEGNTGWVIISANISNLADRDLSNLTLEGENHFADPDFSNITSVAQAMFDVKEDKENKVTTILSTSTDETFPSTKAVYDFVENSIDNFADRDFNNITTIAEARFLGNNKLGGCVLEAPTLMYRTTDNNFVLPEGTKFLCANGLNENRTYNNLVVDISTDHAGVITTVTSTSGLKGYIFWDDTAGYVRATSENRYFVSTEEPSVPVEADSDGIWYNPADNTYHDVDIIDGLNVWRLAVIAEIGRWETNPDGSVKTFIPYEPIKLVSSLEVAHVVVETGGTEENWYRLYKDGWIEAGGYLTGGGTVNLLKPFKSTHYTLVPSANATDFIKAVNSFTLTVESNSKETDWVAYGWGA